MKSPAGTKIALTGPLTNGTIVTIGVADLAKVSQYHASVQAVAASADFQLRTRPLAAY